MVYPYRFLYRKLSVRILRAIKPVSGEAERCMGGGMELGVCGVWVVLVCCVIVCSLVFDFS